jgi:nicotinamide-nucleotide amidase
MTVRGAVLVTGTEVLTGIIADANGPWLSERMRSHGIEVSHVIVVGDRREDLRAALECLAAQGADMIVISGGLGPTADDLTAEVVAQFAGVPMELDEALEERIAAILTRISRGRRGVDAAAQRAGNRKQALVPAGAAILEPVGTAPGFVVPSRAGGCPVVVLPGPPRELQPMWAEAIRTPAVREVLERTDPLERRMLRLYGLPESELAQSLAAIEADGTSFEGLEITTCQRRGEIEIATLLRPSASAAYDAFAAEIARRHGDLLFSTDGSTVDERVAALLDGRTVATAESCTGGLLAARLTDRPGSSAYVLGGVVAYANEAKTRLAGVPAALIERHGAVSPEVASALADGAVSAFRADFGIGITGVAGPGGGTEAKPVGTVCLSVASGAGLRMDRTVLLPGDRAMIRQRTTTLALHMLRGLLEGSSDLPGR